MRYIVLATFAFGLLLSGCVPDIVRREALLDIPQQYHFNTDTVSSASLDWRSFYNDTILTALVDSALHNNKELNVVMQEVSVAQNEVSAKTGEYLPMVNLGVGVGVEKTGQYTRNGAVEDQLKVTPGESFPEPLANYGIGVTMSWEIDIWRKLRNARDASSLRYLSTIQGLRFLVTSIVSEVASNYYELLALDNRIEAVDTNIAVLRRALFVVEQQKSAAHATELAVRKFEAEVLKNESHRFDVLQLITETENRLNFLLGRYPQPIERKSNQFLTERTDTVRSGLPSQLLENRTDVRQADLSLKATDLDIDVARAKFYPTINIMAGFGYQAFNAKYIVTSPESMLYNIAGEIMMPLINRAAISAEYRNAGARQVQAAYTYEATLINAYIEVANHLAKVENTRGSFERKALQVDALRASVAAASSLYLSARADYMEVLMTQRDALEAKIELIETKLEQMHARVDLYRALGGGWR